MSYNWVLNDSDAFRWLPPIMKKHEKTSWACINFHWGPDKSARLPSATVKGALETAEVNMSWAKQGADGALGLVGPKEVIIVGDMGEATGEEGSSGFSGLSGPTECPGTATETAATGATVATGVSRASKGSSTGEVESPGAQEGKL